MGENVALRLASDADREAVRRILEAAFGGPAEADLVDALAADGDLAALIVAEAAGRVVGVVALSPMGGMAALALAPVAVTPDAQRRGIGKALVREALHFAKENDAAAVFVLGDPAYYEPLGFSRACAQEVRSLYSGPHFMAANLRGAGALAPGAVEYAPAFAALG